MNLLARKTANTDTDTAPRWPPVEGGLPVVSIQELLAPQRDLLVRLNHECGETSDVWETHYRPVVDRMARWFHLLPASREHHHYGAGGLLRHSLESAIAAAGLFDRVIVGQTLTYQERSRYRIGFRWAAIIGAMLHDCAKPMTDLSVTGERTGVVWNPLQGSLAGWAEQAKETRYRIRWRPQRAGLHRIGAAVMLPRIIGTAGLAWLVEMSGQQALLDLVEAVLDGEQPGTLSSILTDADRISVADDLARRGDLNEDHRIDGMAAEHHILDAIKSLLRDGDWKPGGKVCAKSKDGRVFLAWPRAGRDIADWLTRHQMPGIVRTPEAIADVLLDTGLAERGDPTVGDGASRGYYRFRTTDNLELHGLRLRADNGLGTLLESTAANGVWLDLPAAGPSQAASESPSESLAASESPSESLSQGPSQAPSPADKTSHTGTAPGAPPHTPNPTTNSTPSMPADSTAVPMHERISECEIASAIIEDLALGKIPSKLLFWDGRNRYLAYPDAFRGYGMAPMAAAKTLVQSELAETDGNRVAVDIENAPFKKGVCLARSEPPANPESAAIMVEPWFKAQADEDVRDVKGCRYVSVENLRRWASLFGTPETVIETLSATGLISLGTIGDTQYARTGAPKPAPTDAKAKP